MSGGQQEVISDGLQLADGEGRGGESLEQPAAVGECPVNSVKPEGGQEELKGGEEEEERTISRMPKHGRFRTSKADEGKSCSVQQHCARGRG